MDYIRAIERQQIREDIPEVRVGDNVKVHYRIVEGGGKDSGSGGVGKPLCGKCQGTGGEANRIPRQADGHAAYCNGHGDGSDGQSRTG